MTKAATAPSGTEYVWTFSGCPVRVHISLTVVGQLGEHLLAAESNEAGGLLLGIAKAGRVEITGIDLFKPRHRGRHFVLAGADAEAFRARVQEHAHEVVGYFRTDLRTGIRLSNEDTALILDLFRDPKFVFLVARVQAGTPEAGFFFWDKGSVFGEASFLHFPLVPHLLKAGPEPAQRDEAAAPHITLPVLQAPEAPPPQPKTRAASTRNTKRVWFTVSALVAASLPIYYAPRTLLIPATQPGNKVVDERVLAAPLIPSSLSLSALRINGGVAIMWDAARAAISDARIGVLTVNDGPNGHEFPLTKAQLQMRKLMYFPRTDRIEVTLEVFAAEGQRIRESMIVVVGPASVRSERTASTQSQPVTEELRPAVRTFTPPASPLATPRDVRLLSEPLPAVQTASGAASDLLKVPTSFDLPGAPPARPETPASPSKPPTSVDSAPVQPPKINSKVNPVVPASVWQRWVGGPVHVQIRVTIDSDGKVTAAAPIEVPANGSHAYLAKLAANAAYRWTFVPARRGDTPLPGEMVLNFRFERKR